MTFLITYAKGFGNYGIIICGGGLGLPLCILGQIIQVKADNLSETLYQTNWHELSLKDQKTFLIVLGMAQREYGLKAAGVYDINLYTFVQEEEEDEELEEILMKHLKKSMKIFNIGLGNYLMIICGGGLALPLCVLGEFIRVKTDKLSDTFYLTNWYDLSLKDQKTFLIVLGMVQREYGLKAAGMYDVNLYTFVQIFKIAFSYCAVLYSLSQ
ncbi:uncharacterized protein LOC129794552 [Lutzomyia longipalpis]|uniref:uncharacterized protein LOC129794552 n=1 Tax=Lutzomyia longipalpis TaxID=7200 RepID=UPI0024832FE6|nr:uncharacterized protein LOC129794552 [Lutzomyia longipalpis]